MPRIADAGWGARPGVQGALPHAATTSAQPMYSCALRFARDEGTMGAAPWEWAVSCIICQGKQCGLASVSGEAAVSRPDHVDQFLQ